MNGTVQRRPGGGRPGSAALPSSVDEWLASLSGQRRSSAPCFAPLRDEQLRRGYGHTAARDRAAAGHLGRDRRAACGRARARSSTRASTASRPSSSPARAAPSTRPSASPRGCRRRSACPSRPCPAGLILTHPEACLPPTGPFLVVSLARSGNSPESRAVVDWLLESRPQARHLFITCNRDGALATSYRDRPDVRTVVLDEKTNDRSLVMTSSFTNLVLAGRALGGDPEACEARGPRARAGRRRPAARARRRARRGRAERLLLGRLPRQRLPARLRARGRAQDAGDERGRGLDPGRVLPRPAARADVGDPPGHAGRRVPLLGPAGARLRARPAARARPQGPRRGPRGRRRGAVPAGVAPAATRSSSTAPPRAPCADEEIALLDAVVGQLLAFFRCLAAGRRPDSPSEDSVITRVVSGFEIHSPQRRTR